MTSDVDLFIEKLANVERMQRELLEAFPSVRTAAETAAANAGKTSATSVSASLSEFATRVSTAAGTLTKAAAVFEAENSRLRNHVPRIRFYAVLLILGAAAASFAAGWAFAPSPPAGPVCLLDPRDGTWFRSEYDGSEWKLCAFERIGPVPAPAPR